MFTISGDYGSGQWPVVPLVCAYSQFSLLSQQLMSYTRLLPVLTSAIVALLLGCTQSDAPEDVTTQDRLLDYVGSLESAVGSSRQELKQVANEMTMSIAGLQAQLSGSEWETASRLASQVEAFSGSVDSESSEKLAERIAAMKELLAQTE